MLDALALDPHLQNMMELVDRVFCIYKEATPAKSRARFRVVQKWVDRIHHNCHPLLDSLEAAYITQMGSSAENVLPSAPQDVALLGVVDIQPVLAQHADLEGDLLDLLDLLQRLPAKPDRQGIRWLDE